MTLQAKLDAFKADFEAGKPPYSVPPSAIEVMHRATAELKASGAAGLMGAISSTVWGILILRCLRAREAEAERRIRREGPSLASITPG